MSSSHENTGLCREFLGPTGTDSRPWACLWDLTQVLHPNCSEAPECSKKVYCYNAYMMEDTKVKVGAWDSDFSGLCLEMAIRKCIPRFEAYMRKVPTSGFGYMS
jgi:hypothetical protein